MDIKYPKCPECSVKETPSHLYGYSSDQEDRRETEQIYLTHGGVMQIDHVPPEEDDDPWNNDNDPLGPQAA